MRIPLIDALLSQQRDVKVIFLANFLWYFGFGLYFNVWPIYIKVLGGGSSEIGLLFAFSSAITMLTFIPGGILADKLERKKLILASYIVAMPSSLFYLLATNWSQLIPGILLYYSSFFGVPVTNAYITSLSGTRSSTSTYGAYYSGAPLALIFSPLFGGAIHAIWGFDGIFIISFTISLVSLTCLLFSSNQPPNATENATLNVPKLFRKIYRDTSAIFFIVWTFAFSLIIPFLAPYLQDVKNFDAVTIQIFGSLMYLGSAITNLCIGSFCKKWSYKVMVFVSLIIFASSISLLLAFQGFLGIAFAMFLLGVFGVRATMSYSMIADGAPLEAIGRLISVFQTFESLVITFSYYFSGLLYGLHVGLPFILSMAIVAILLPLGMHVTWPTSFRGDS